MDPEDLVDEGVAAEFSANGRAFKGSAGRDQRALGPVTPRALIDRDTPWKVEG